MTQNTYRHGHFVWHELMTPDGAAAEKFYTELLGWKFRHTVISGNRPYRLIDANGREQGGMFEICPEEKIPAHWCGYVSVPDVDEAIQLAKQHGGKVPCEPIDVPNVGRFAYVLDPEGAGFTVYRDAQGDAPAPAMPGLGDFCWDSLTVHDGERALAFYSAVVGWTRGQFGDAPGLFFATKSGETIADVDAPQGGAPSFWTTHVVVANLAESRTKAQTLGATILVAEINVPNIGQMALISDPWGAVISLFEPQMPG
jgi:uncharacterized protein